MENDLLKVPLLSSKVSPHSLWDCSSNPGISKYWKPSLFTVTLVHFSHQALRLNMAWSWPGKRPGFPTLDGSPKGEVSLNTRAGTRR